MSKRENGYYWLLIGENWIIGEWDDFYWTLTGANEKTYSDNHFDYIDPTPITRNGE